MPFGTQTEPVLAPSTEWQELGTGEELTSVPPHTQIQAHKTEIHKHIDIYRSKHTCDTLTLTFVLLSLWELNIELSFKILFSLTPNTKPLI